MTLRYNHIAFFGFFIPYFPSFSNCSARLWAKRVHDVTLRQCRGTGTIKGSCLGLKTSSDCRHKGHPSPERYLRLDTSTDYNVFCFIIIVLPCRTDLYLLYFCSLNHSLIWSCGLLMESFGFIMELYGKIALLFPSYIDHKPFTHCLVKVITLEGCCLCVLTNVHLTCFFFYSEKDKWRLE